MSAELFVLLNILTVVILGSSLSRAFLTDMEFFSDGTKPRDELARLLVFALASPVWCAWQLVKGIVLGIANAVRVLWRNDPIGSQPREESNAMPDVEREPAARGRKVIRGE